MALSEQNDYIKNIQKPPETKVVDPVLSQLTDNTSIADMAKDIDKKNVFDVYKYRNSPIFNADTLREGNEKRMPPQRDQMFLDFITILKKTDFKQYPRIRESYEDLQKSLKNISINDLDFFKSLEEGPDDTSKNNTPQSLVNLKENILKNIEDKDKETNLNEAEKMLKKFYIRSLEVLSVYQNQQRNSLISHRAFGFGEELDKKSILDALKQGVQEIEMDVALTKDGEIVVSHDTATKINKKLTAIEDVTLSEIQASGAKMSDSNTDIYKLTDLTEVLENYEGLSMLNIEIKDRNVTKVMIDLLEKNPKLQKCVLISAFDAYSLMDIHKKFPNIPLGYNTMIDDGNIEHYFDPIQKEVEPQINFKAKLMKKLAGKKFKGEPVTGGNTLPYQEKGQIMNARHDQLPENIREMLRKCGGHIAVQTTKTLMNPKLEGISEYLKMKKTVSALGIDKLKEFSQKAKKLVLI